MAQTLSEKLIAVLDKGKSIEEMIEAYHQLGTALHEKIETHRKELIEKANQLPTINKEKT
jgi:hypothetical protein